MVYFRFGNNPVCANAKPLGFDDCVSMHHQLYQREQRDLRKLRKVMDPSELALTHPQMSHEEHVTQLHQAYKELEAEYRKVIEKLAATPDVM